jgi:arsenate reductase
MKKVLFLCTGNSCRSQMAEGLVNHDFADRIAAFSAGTEPHGLNPVAVRVMAEIGIDIRAQTSDHLDKYAGQPFDYVITLCDNANETCPVFMGGVKRIHMGFDDPPKAAQTVADPLPVYRRVRDALRQTLAEFFNASLAS